MKAALLIEKLDDGVNLRVELLDHIACKGKSTEDNVRVFP